MRINFLSKDETLRVITNNTPFYQTFSPADLHARHVNSVDEYVKLLKEKKVTSTPTIYQQFVLEICTIIADIRLLIIENKENYQHLKGISALTWNIGVTNNNFYEGGMAHTIKTKDDVVIILPLNIIEKYSWNELINTLIHEKVHVYQKTYQEKIDNYLKDNHYKRDISISKDTLYRANPDIDSNIYIHIPSNKIYDMKYTSSNPSSVSDTVHFSYENEHPYEEMAIHIENI